MHGNWLQLLLKEHELEEVPVIIPPELTDAPIENSVEIESPADGPVSVFWLNRCNN